MGIEGRPERGSKVKAMNKLTEASEDDDDSTHKRPSRKKRRHIDSDDSPPKASVPNAIIEATASASRAVNASRRRDVHQPINSYMNLSDSEDNDDDDDRPSDPDHVEPQPVKRSVKLRLPIGESARALMQTRSGRVSRPPPADPLDNPSPPQTRRRSSGDLARSMAEIAPNDDHPRYPLRRRSRATYEEEDASEEILDEQIRPSRLRKRTSREARLDAMPLRHNQSDDDDDDQFDDDDEEERMVNRSKNGKRTRGRLTKLEELEQTPSPVENRRETRSSRRAKSTPVTYEPAQYNTRRSKSGSKKRTDMQNGSASKDEEVEIDGEDGEPDGDVRDSDREFKPHSDESEPDDGEHDEPLKSQDLLQTPEEPDDDDENDPDHDENPRRRSLRPRNRGKTEPQRTLRKSRKRLRDANTRQENSLAKRARESYRPRNESVRRSDFYNRDGESESSDSSGAMLTEGRRRPTREAATRATDRIAHANDVSNVDLLQNPMGLADPGRAPRPKRRSTHRGRMRPSRHESFVSDDDDPSATAGAAPIEPIQVDPNLTWDDIGGLDHHVRALKEMVFLPLMYPEVFEKFKMEAPKGVLFYGQPGTGKTLCARALAASCGVEPDAEAVKSEEKAGGESSASQGKTAENEAATKGGKDANGNVEKSAMNTMADVNSSLNHEAEKMIETLIAPTAQDAGSKSAERGEKPAEDAPAKSAAEAGASGDVTNTEKSAGSSEKKPPVKKKPRVAFFMRNGADCLSKWVGEAERQLRMTFEAAKRHQPAIIFFDEIDGLAPVRSSRQDQIHASIVSTLLGLMDGLDSRGKIVVIGATNRVDAIDPALRRPGRFDRELIFTLPNAEARRKILKIHTKDWKPPLKDRVIDAVGDLTVGYCGADLKALCSEAAIRALRRRYPQIYNSNEKLLIDIDQVRVGAKDFMAAMKDVVPASHRSAITYARPIPDRLAAVLNGPLRECLVTLQRIFPQGLAQSNVDPRLHLSKSGDSENKLADDLDSSDDEDDDDNVNIQLIQSKMQNAGKLRANAAGVSSQSHSLRPRLLVCGAAGLGQTQLGPAILHNCEGCPVHAIDYPTLHAESGARSPQEALIAAFREASRSLPSILYLPHLELWWSSADDSLRTMLSILLNQIPADSPLLVLATAEVPHSQLPRELMNFFVEVHELGVPTQDCRKAMFEPLVTAAQKVPSVTAHAAQQKRKMRAEEVLPKAPPPPPKKLSKDEEMRKQQGEARYIRMLRMEMRSFVESLLRDRRFKAFWTPVDPTSAPDYYEIIKNPMDIQKIAANVDAGRYPTVVAMVNDFDVMVRNAIQYNPPNTEVGALILRRAHGLIDIVHAWVDNLNLSLVETCNKIIADRVERAKAAEGDKGEGDETGENKEETGGASAAQNETRKSDDTLGKDTDEKMGEMPAEATSAEAVAANPEAEANPKASRRPDVMDVDALVNPAAGSAEADGGEDEVKVAVVEASRASVEYLAKEFEAVSSGMTVDGLEGLYVQCEKVVLTHRRSPDRAEAVRALQLAVARARDDPALVMTLVE